MKNINVMLVKKYLIIELHIPNILEDVKKNYLALIAASKIN